MSARKPLLSIAAIVLPSLFPVEAVPQGFAGLGSSAEGFSMPRRGEPLVFPRDHGAHPDYRIEWWYVTADLEAADGRKLGAQWTLFRSALAPGEKPGWSDPQIWIGHAAVTTSDRQYVAERLARGGVGQAGAVAAPFEAWIDDRGHEGCRERKRPRPARSPRGRAGLLDIGSRSGRQGRWSSKVTGAIPSSRWRVRRATTTRNPSIR